MPRSVHRSKEIDRSIPCRALGTTRILPRQTEVLEAAAQRPTPRWSVPHPADRLHGSPCLFLAPHVLNDLAVMPSPPSRRTSVPASQPANERDG
jgi:hypothetical protein